MFPTEEAQNNERQRLFKILEDLVVWENSNNEDVLNAAKAEIMKSTGGNPPELLDPFAGGGAIPLEAQRLGLKAHAHDLNPVAVMINKAMIEIPPRFAGMPPVNPDARVNSMNNTWERAQGLAEDVRYYGEWMKNEAFKRIGHLYPKVKVPAEQESGEATVIAWIWARTVKCPNPACGCEMPLASSFILSKKKGNEAWIDPEFDGKKIKYIVRHGKCPKEKETIKLAKGAAFRCAACGATTEKEYIHDQFINKKVDADLMAIVAEGKAGRVYLSPNEKQEKIAKSAIPNWIPDIEMNIKSTDLVSGRGYGITKWNELFTNRQLLTLSTFSSLISDVIVKAERDAIIKGMKNDHLSLKEKGNEAKAYGEAIGVYLSFLIDQLSNQSSSFCGWNSVNTQMRCVFARQAIPMTWDYAECNIFSSSSGSYKNLLDRMVKAFELLGEAETGEAIQFDAQSDCGLRNIMVSTDPPYYDNICYSDLSDFFYIWMRKSIYDIYPDLFGTMLVPKSEELVALKYRHDGNSIKAKKFFEDGMLSTCKQIHKYAREDVPVTIYYAYKQSESNDDGKASSGWETMLSAIIDAGFALTGTWPMRTEKPGRTIENGTNALASSIVLVCRKRPEDAPQTTRRNLIAILRRELRPALKKLQESNIAPVDLAQSAIGPGMGVFSRYSRVLEADGTPMSVRSALHIINEEIDLYFNEQVGDMDSASRFCIDLYTQYAYNDVKYGEAEVLANAKSTSIPMLAANGILYAKAGIVHIVERDELPEKSKESEEIIWLLTQQLTRAMAKGGIEACAKLIVNIFGSAAERAKDLAYRLYTIAEQKKWTNEAYAYNALVVAWPDIQSRAASIKRETEEQMDLFTSGLISKD